MVISPGRHRAVVGAAVLLVLALAHPAPVGADSHLPVTVTPASVVWSFADEAGGFGFYPAPYATSTLPVTTEPACVPASGSFLALADPPVPTVLAVDCAGAHNANGQGAATQFEIDYDHALGDLSLGAAAWDAGTLAVSRVAPDGIVGNPSVLLFGDTMEVVAPAGTVDRPTEVYLSVPGDVIPANREFGDVFPIRTGGVVQECDAPGRAVPDPCFVRHPHNDGDDLLLTVLTVDPNAHEWGVGTYPPPVIIMPEIALWQTTDPAGGPAFYGLPWMQHFGTFVALPTCDPPPGAPIPVGANTITCTGAEDSYGVSDPATFTLEVEYVDSGVAVGVSSRVAGTATITRAASGDSPDGYVIFGERVVITAPASTPDDALELIFYLTPDMIPDGLSVRDVEVFRNGVRVAPCETTPQAEPDPCVSGRVHADVGGFVITVYTSEASDWAFVLPERNVARYVGADRYETAAAVSQADYAHAGAVDTVFVATGADFPDALAGAVVAAREQAPLLLVQPDAIPPATAAELARLGPDQVVVLGGGSAVSVAVLAALGESAATVSRIGGLNRYETAVQLSQRAFPDPATVDEVIVATGTNFPDALGGGPVGAVRGAPVLLTPGGSLPDVVRAEVERLAPARITVLGGTSAVSDEVVTALQALAPTSRVAGDNRYLTAVEASATTFPLGAGRVYLAVGTNFPDALAGAAAAGAHSGPVLLTPTAALPAAVATELARLDPHTVVILGGTGAIAQSVADEVAALLGL